MPSTNKGFPYPAPSDANNVPADIQALADAVEAWPGIPSLTQAQINALSSAARTVNLHVYNSTTGKTQRWTGSAWIDLVVDNDARLSNARTPTTHAASHIAGGTDALTLSQSQISGLSDALNARVSAAAVAYQSWTPALSGTGWTFRTHTTSGKYLQVGKFVHAVGTITWGAGGSEVVGSGSVLISLPVSSATADRISQMGVFAMLDSSLGAQFSGTCRVNGATTLFPMMLTQTPAVNVANDGINNVYQAGSGIIATDSGDTWRFSIVYEAA